MAPMLAIIIMLAMGIGTTGIIMLARVWPWALELFPEAAAGSGVLGSSRAMAMLLESRMRARHTAEGFRQSLRLPRATTSSWVSWSASRSCRAAKPSILFSRMNSSTSGDAAGGSLGTAAAAREASAPGSNDRFRSKARFSCATRMRPISAVLGFWQSVSSPRSSTARWTSGACARSAEAARLSTSLSARNLSSSSSSSLFLAVSVGGTCGRSSGTATGAMRASRIRARHTAEGFRQFLKLPRLRTLF
mmetsp:Transcript_67117/g.185901  ORF Transcript_67117/g.185901 Transcript_67117/m.185901 type:complete len:248 (+) Transcript_67117:389-1132(+)